MENNIQVDPWYKTDEGFNAHEQLNYESIYTLGNGYLEQSGSFEENYSGETTVGAKLKVADLKSSTEGVDSQFIEKHIAAPNLTRVVVRLNEEILDLALWDVQTFNRELNMKDGVLTRNFVVTSPKGHQIQVVVKRFVSLDTKEIAAISYKVKSINFDGRISFMPIIDGNILNELDEPLWNVLQVKTDFDVARILLQIRRKDIQLCAAMSYEFLKNNEPFKVIPAKIEKEKQVGYSVGCDVKKGESVMLNKYVAIVDSINYPKSELSQLAGNIAQESKQQSWKHLFENHKTRWNMVWENWESQQPKPVKDTSAKLYDYFNVFQNS